MIVVQVTELQALLGQAQPWPGLIGRILARAVARLLDPAAAAAQLLTGSPLAAAAIGRLRDAPGEKPGAVWMRADPIGLIPDLNAVWVRPGVHLAARHPALPELNALFTEAGLAFELMDPTRVYLRLPAQPDCHFQPPAALAGQSLDHALPEGPDARFWRRLLNDCQIILHQYRDQSEVGGLWFWGAGALPPREQLAPRVRRVYSLDPDLLALADWLGLPHEPLDATARVADESLVSWTPDPGRDAGDNLMALADWLQPLWWRLRSGRIDALELAGQEQAWMLRPAQAWQLWRRRSASPA